jgi:hypothetical protein
MNELPPTPQTNALNRNLREACRDEYMYSEMLAFAQMLERERNEMRNALENIEDRFVDGKNTHDDWLFMGTTARTVLAKLSNHLR